MSEVSERLARCFQAVLPELPSDQLAGASIQTCGSWDSLATMRLIAVIEEEFDVSIPTQTMTEMISFGAIEGWLNERA